MTTSSSSTTTMNEKKKRKYLSDGKDVLESFAVLEDATQPEIIHTLILGTMPSHKSFGHELSDKEILLRGGTGPQNYGSSRNTFWNIVGSAFGFQRHTTSYDDQVRILNQHGYAVWDVLKETKRLGSLDQNIVKGSEVPNDLPQYLHTHPNLTRFVFAANSAKEFCKPNVFRGWLQTGHHPPSQIQKQSTSRTPASSSSTVSEPSILETKFWIRGENLNPETYNITKAIFGKKTYPAVQIITNATEAELASSSSTTTSYTPETTVRMVEMLAMPSTSPASAALRPPEKEKLWHIACYNYTNGQPPAQYQCPGCCDQHPNQNKKKQQTTLHHARHWFQDCPYREEWKDAKRNNVETTHNNTATKRKRPPSQQQQPITEKDIDPFRWYL